MYLHETRLEVKEALGPDKRKTSIRQIHPAKIALLEQAR
jgi:hypothetical protein